VSSGCSICGCLLNRASADVEVVWSGYERALHKVVVLGALAQLLAFDQQWCGMFEVCMRSVGIKECKQRIHSNVVRTGCLVSGIAVQQKCSWTALPAEPRACGWPLYLRQAAWRVHGQAQLLAALLGMQHALSMIGNTQRAVQLVWDQSGPEGATTVAYVYYASMHVTLSHTTQWYTG
jgi:hypothetical protein